MGWLLIALCPGGQWTIPVMSVHHQDEIPRPYRVPSTQPILRHEISPSLWVSPGCSLDGGSVALFLELVAYGIGDFNAEGPQVRTANESRAGPTSAEWC